MPLFIKKKTVINIPEGYFFDKHLGAWVSAKSQKELVNHKDFPGGGGTKKCDIETGEDQKGQ